ncbi:hypothetical protein ITJ64_05605 [Herbiconiux sp. VKM Ac-1786]|uniref:hypothetical protein n=1 Tax=Herbiconiux sp. VKM Ac-1786 TaxID=2783824 RepID=UPI00188DC5AE|nr:hypothetical protein [Herbiconiux sp. VKM Ac-1786]MBF4571987.1 hypothetical protein [Herbiconiux sp. VKM Ac-1786]
MNSASNSQAGLFRAATVMTVVIAVGFVVFGLAVQSWGVVAVFTVIGIAGLSTWPTATRRSDRA